MSKVDFLLNTTEFLFPDISAVNLMVKWNLLACSIK